MVQGESTSSKIPHWQQASGLPSARQVQKQGSNGLPEIDQNNPSSKQLEGRPRRGLSFEQPGHNLCCQLLVFCGLYVQVQNCLPLLRVSRQVLGSQVVIRLERISNRTGREFKATYLLLLICETLPFSAGQTCGHRCFHTLVITRVQATLVEIDIGSAIACDLPIVL